MPKLLFKKMDYAIVLCLLTLTLALGLYLGRMAFDDPFVTYRYARNISRGYGLVYNQGEHVLSTTAPLYALLLAGGALLIDDLPALSNWLNIIALFAGGCFIYLLCREFRYKWMGLIAAMLFITSPLLWLSLGFESSFYLVLVLGAFYFYFRDQLLITAALLALALLTRGDGIIPAAVLNLHYFVTRHRFPWQAVAVYLALSAPLLIYLMLVFGSPLPVTLAAKAAQAKLGVTGFYAHTTFFEGAWILTRAYLQQSKLYLFFVPCMLIGMMVILRHGRWLWPMLLWAALYFSAYQLLGVAPYHWYYVPLIPAFVFLIAWGAAILIARISSWLEWPGWLIAAAAGALGVLLLVPQFTSDAQMHQALLHPGGIAPESTVYKVLPEAKVEVYRQVGEWLKEHTPEDAVIGVTEVGVIGYYSERTMVDFLGLLHPDVVDALKRGDMSWALLYYQPDYVVLTQVNPLYSYDLRADEWFKLAYVPVQVFEDPRFWGGPVTVYRRQIPRYAQRSSSEIPPEAVPLHARFGDQIELLAYAVDKNALRPGDILNVTLYWQCLAPVNVDYTVFVHLLGQHDLIVAQRDAYPCLSACPTRGWKPGEVFADPHILALPVTTFTPDEAQLEIGLYDRISKQRLIATSAQGQILGDNVRFQPLTIVPAQEGSIPNAMLINFGNQIALVGYNLDRRTAAPGESFHLTLYWRALQTMRENYSVFTHLLSEGGERVAQMDSWPQRGAAPTSTWQPDGVVKDDYELTVPQNAPPGVYSIHVGLYLAKTQQRLWVLDAASQPQTDHVVLTRVRVGK